MKEEQTFTNEFIIVLQIKRNYFQVLCLFALVTVAVAQPGHNYGSAYSSQYVSRHDGHAEPIKTHDGYGHGHGYKHVDYYVSKFTFFHTILLLKSKL